MTSSTSIMSLEQRIYDLLSPYRILGMLAGHVNENKDEDEAAYTIFTRQYISYTLQICYTYVVPENLAHLARHHFNTSYGEFDPHNVTVVSARDEKSGNSKLAVFLRTKHYQYNILEAEVDEGGDWIGELIKVVNEQMQRVIRETEIRQCPSSVVDSAEPAPFRFRKLGTWKYAEDGQPVR
jgi:hypothetical protein